MAKIVFTNKAKEDLKQIWEYTYETWSEKQADKYYEEIIQSCLNLIVDQEQGKNYSIIFENLKGIKCNKHIIFYRVLKSRNIEIERILHEKMDVKKHLNE
ncbi:MAG: hypothetical protein RLZZ546_1180 [Bacteroidota bacterium]|jgi:toxin ParE1/3/4